MNEPATITLTAHRQPRWTPGLPVTINFPERRWIEFDDVWADFEPTYGPIPSSSDYDAIEEQARKDTNEAVRESITRLAAAIRRFTPQTPASPLPADPASPSWPIAPAADDAIRQSACCSPYRVKSPEHLFLRLALRGLGRLLSPDGPESTDARPLADQLAHLGYLTSPGTMPKPQNPDHHSVHNQTAGNHSPIPPASGGPLAPTHTRSQSRTFPCPICGRNHSQAQP